MKRIVIAYTVISGLLAIYSYGFVDPNFPITRFTQIQSFVLLQRPLATVLYCFFILGLLFLYLFVLRSTVKKKIGISEIKTIILATSAVLIISFPAFSYDIFNYIATAKVTFLYKENPYIIMPIEIKNEPMLAFMHAANKTALYGPVWIGLTSIPHFLGLGDLLFTIFTVKVFILLFYLGLCWLIWRLTKNALAVALFGLNPLVLIETLVSAHNDVVMMFLALFSFFCLQQKKVALACIALLLSIGIKYATLFLVPIFVYVIVKQQRKAKIHWPRVWLYCSVAMYGIFLLSPLREELYSWYFIWPLSFVSLLGSVSHYSLTAIAFSTGLLFRFAPFLYTGVWSGSTPLIKFYVSYFPPVLTSLVFLFKKVRQ